jgi:hypothetical protein
MRARLVLLLLTTCSNAAARADAALGELRELRRFEAREARQGVAVDARHFYAIDSRAIGKYDKQSGARVGEYLDPDGATVQHLNSGIVIDGRLYCAHSNFPELPMRSSIEVFDTETLEHVESRGLEVRSGSATWIDRHAGHWWVSFANYAGAGGAPGRGPESTQLIRFDHRWRALERFAFPGALIERFGTMSNSGGAFGPGRLLYATGHDAPELYALRVPALGAALDAQSGADSSRAADEQLGAGAATGLEARAGLDTPLELAAVLRVAAEGQGIAWDPSDRRVLYSIVRSAREVVVSRLVDAAESGR